MAKTVQTSASSYIPAAAVIARVDARVLSDLCSDSGTRIPDATALATNGNFLALLLDASGVVEMAVSRGSRYTPADLAALTGAGQAGLFRLLCRIIVVLAFERRPDREMKQPWVLEQAEQDLSALADGIEIFPFVEAEKAGVANSSTETPEDVEARGGVTFITRRFLGTRSNRRRDQG